ncbi:MAG: divergent polysaccharide deacetylase family protein, partial [Terriglobia bacterium]
MTGSLARPRQLILALLIAVAMVCSACKPSVKRTKHRHEATAHHENILPLFVRAIERAGGDGVWIKSRDLHLSRAEHKVTDPTVEVILTARARTEVLEAMRREAETESLGLRIRPASTPSENTTGEVLIESSGRRLCNFRLVEVRRILQAAIIIDDLGQNLNAAHELAGLNYPLTFSIMPRVLYARETAELARRSGLEVMLHLPMQPRPASHARISSHEIRAGMSSDEVERTVEQDLGDVPFVAGVNNHMGSQATADPKLMAAVMTVLASRHLFFIDSRTTVDTVALDVARRRGIPSFYRSVFLDDTRNVNYTLGQLRQFCDVVKKQGAAIAIGHPYPTTLAALARFLPEFESEQIELVPASRLARSPEFAHLSPP